MKELFFALLTNPAIQGILAGIFMNVLQFFWSSKNAKTQEAKNQLLAQAIAESGRLVNTELSNDEKRAKVVEFLYNYIPANIKNTVSEKMLENIANQAYHSFVKQ